MRSFFSFAGPLGALVLVAGCSSTVDGAGQGSQTPGFDIAVGAEVTLTFREGNCERTTGSPSEGCLKERPNTLKAVTLASSDVFTMVDSSLDRTREVVVRVRAQKAGVTTLAIEHADFRGQAVREEFMLRAHDITDVKESVGCQWPDPPSRRYAITPSSTFNVNLTAMAGETPLLSGALELVTDRGGVELLDGPERPSRRARVPAAPGTYAWNVVGTQARPITFDVYDRAAVAIDLESTEKGVTVRPAVNGAPVCLYDGDARASVSVVEGACHLLVGDFEVEGALPVTFAQGGATLTIGGTGGCTVEGRLGTGSSDRVMVAPTEVLTPAAPGAGETIGESPIVSGGELPPNGACTRVTKVGNDKCEAINAGGFVLPDGDCFSDWEWKLDHRDDSGSFERGPVGVGLLTELRVSVEFSIFLIGVATFSPNNLGFGAVPPPGLDLLRLGCSGTKYEALGIRAKSSGVHKLGMVADNAPDPRVYDVEARPIAKATYLKGVPAPQSKFFVRSSAPLEVTYADSGNTKLRGIAPLRVTGTDAGAEAKFRASGIFTGTRPNKITIGSDVAPQTQVIDVVDATAITEIKGLAPQDVRAVGEELCVEPSPASGGQIILGSAPERGRVAFTGDGCAVGGGPTRVPPSLTNRLCLVGGGPTATEVRVSWGAVATAVWSCKMP